MLHDKLVVLSPHRLRNNWLLQMKSGETFSHQLIITKSAKIFQGDIHEVVTCVVHGIL